MILIILPVKNEKYTIESTALNLLKWCGGNLGKDFNILFLDDRSTDGTFNKLKLLHNEKLKVLKNKFDNGKGSALKAGLIYSEFLYRLNENDLVVFLDGDGQIGFDDIKTLIRQMEFYDADAGIGNKRHLYSSINYSLKRQIVSKVYNFIVRKLFGFEYKDTQCGIKIFKYHVLDSLIHKITNKRYAFDIELIVALKQMGFRVVDSPVKVKKQKNVGSVSLDSIINTFTDTIKVWNKMRKGFYNHE